MGNLLVIGIVQRDRRPLPWDSHQSTVRLSLIPTAMQPRMIIWRHVTVKDSTNLGYIVNVTPNVLDLHPQIQNALKMEPLAWLSEHTVLPARMLTFAYSTISSPPSLLSPYTVSRQL